MDSYLKVGFIQCPDTDQLPRPQCVICATVLGNEAMKPSRLIRHLNTKHSDLINKPIEFLCVKEKHLKYKIKEIQLSSDTVERRISDMAEDTETKLTEKIKKSKLFAL